MQKPTSRVGSRGYSLRTLFIVSFFIAVPFLVGAIARSDFKTADAAGAPIFLLAGVGAVLLGALVGFSFAQKTGAYIGTLAVGGIWISAISAMFVTTDVKQRAFSLGLHAGASFISTSLVLFWIHFHREPTIETEPSRSLEKLLAVKAKCFPSAGKPEPPKE